MPRTFAIAAYDRVAVILHWLIAALLLAQLALGWWMLDVPKSPPGVRAGWFNLHKSLGLTLAALILLRLAWRLAHRPPPPSGLPACQLAAARASHAALYACMLAMPLSGYLGSAFRKYPLRLFGLALPKWSAEWPAGKAFMGEVHAVVAWSLEALICVHVAAALWHALRRDGIFRRMWPATTTRSKEQWQDESALRSPHDA